MSMKRLVLAASVAIFGLSLAGCVDGGPYYGDYTYSGYSDPYYGPGYYSGGVVYGGYYTSRRGHYDRRHHRRDRSHYRDRDRQGHAERDRRRNWQDRRGRSPNHAATRSSGGRYVVRTTDTEENGRRVSRHRNDERQ